MKTTFIVCSLSLCSALTVLAAESTQGSAVSEPKPDEQPTLPFYINVNPGVTWIQNVSIHEGSQSGTLEFHPGARLDFAFGYNLNPNWAIEAEVGMIFINTSSVRINGAGEATDEFLSQYPFMFNVRYQFPTHSRWHPYVGAGIGGSYTTLEEDVDFFFSNTVGHDTTFNYQLFGGVRYQIARHFEWGMQYKFMGTTEHDFGGVHIDSTFSHTLSVILNIPF
jgi:opacity protein-like surface antigen